MASKPVLIVIAASAAAAVGFVVSKSAFVETSAPVVKATDKKTPTLAANSVSY